MDLNLFLMIAGLILGLGAITVIDWHSFLGRNSPYWTEATTRTHKVTKPLIWTGTILFILGYFLYFKGPSSPLAVAMGLILIPMALNGAWLSFYVSPILLKKEREGRAQELLPSRLQRKIFLSFIISFLSWWSLAVLLTWHLSA